MKKIFLLFVVVYIYGSLTAQKIIHTNSELENRITAAFEFFHQQLIFSSHLLQTQNLINEYSKATEIIKEINYQEKKNFLDLLVGLKLNHQEYQNKALAFIKFESDKKLTDKISFLLVLNYFQNKDYSSVVKFSDILTLENFTNDEVLFIKFIQAYSYFEKAQFEKSLVLFDLIRQVDTNNPFYADAYYYYSYLQIKLNNNLLMALNGFNKISNNAFYSKIVPYYIAQLMIGLNAPIKTIEYIEKKIADQDDFFYKNELKNLLIKLYYDTKNYSKCVLQEDSAIAKSPNNSYYLGVSYFKLENFEKAIQLLSYIKTPINDSIIYEINFILAQSYLSQKNKLKAFNHLNYCVNNKLKNSIYEDFILYLFAKLGLELGQNKVAQQALIDFAKTHSKSQYLYDVQQLLFINYTNSNNFKEAIKLIPVTKNQNNVLLSKIYYGRALDFYYENNADSMLYFLNKNISLNKNDAWFFSSLLLTANTFYSHQNYSNVISLLKKYETALLSQNNIIKENDLFHFKYILMYSYMHTNNFESALKIIEEIESSIKTISSEFKADILLRKSDCFFMLKQYAIAKNYLLQYLNLPYLEKDYALYQIALIEGISNSSKKIELLEDLLSKYPNTKLYFLALKDISSTQLSLNQFENSIASLKKIILNPLGSQYFPTAYLSIGIAYFNLNKNDEAIHYFTKLVENYPNVPENEEALRFLKDIYTNKGDIEPYIQLIKNNNKIKPEESIDSLYFTVAEIKYRDKKYQEAESLFKTYLTYDSTSPKRIHAFYYLLFINYFNKNYYLTYSIADSIIQAKESRFLEKTYQLLLKIIKQDDSIFHTKKAFQYWQQIYQNSQNLNTKIESLSQLVEWTFEKEQWQQGFYYVTELEKYSKLTDWQKTLIYCFKSEIKLRDSAYLEVLKINDTIQQINKGKIGAKYAFQNATIYFKLNDFVNAEKQSFYVIRNFTAEDTILVLAYILLADIYTAQKDYFNAKATLRSILDNAVQDTFKQVAIKKLIFIEELNAKPKTDSTLQKKYH